MRFSLKKINQILKTKLSVDEVAKLCNRLGFEIEETYQISNLVSQFLVVGKIVEIKKHPQADRLNVCQVMIKPNVTTQIVCGASNVALNKNVIVALPGAELDHITIKKSVIREVESNGMMCSLSEIGVDKKSLSEQLVEGIHLFECPESDLGKNALEFLGLNDYFLELDILADRSDMNNSFNVARELAAVLKIDFAIENCFSAIEADFKNNNKIVIKDEVCFSFSNLFIKDYQKQDSPWWLVRYLIGIKIKSVNLLVDLANYVANLTGNPIDIYDAKKINNHDLEIIKNNQNQEIKLVNILKEKNISNKVVIKNSDQIIALAGSINGQNYAINDNSSALMITSASYDNITMRSYQKEFNNLNLNLNHHIKGTNWTTNKASLELFAKLLKEISKTTLVSNANVANNKKVVTKTIKLPLVKLNSFLGYETDWKDPFSHLARLGFISKLTQAIYEVEIPAYRIDVTLDVNLIAELIRTLDYDKIKTLAPINKEAPTYPQARYYWERNLMKLLQNNNIYNCRSYSLVSEEEYQDYNIFNFKNPIKIKDPLSNLHSVMRWSILPSLLKTLEYNANNYRSDINLFEISSIHYNGREITRHLSIVVNGNLVNSQVFKDLNITNDFFAVKGLIDTIIKTTRNNKISYVALTDNPHFHPGTSALIKVEDCVIGVIGKPHPQHYSKFSPLIVTIDLTKLYNLNKSIQAPTINKLANINRDISFVVAEDITAAQIVAVAQTAPIENLIKVEVSDVYVDDALKANSQKVLSIKYWLKQTDNSYTKEELEKHMEAIILVVCKELNGILRK